MMGVSTSPVNAALSPSALARLSGAILLLALPLHWALGEWVNRRDSEPWPMVVLPSFGRVFGWDRVEIEQVRFLANDARLLEVGDVFAGIPRSWQMGIVRERFQAGADGEVRALRPDVRAWLVERVSARLGAPVHALRLVREHRVFDHRGALLEVRSGSTLTLLEEGK